MIETNEKFFCTKCQKVCSGIDCECDETSKHPTFVEDSEYAGVISDEALEEAVKWLTKEINQNTINVIERRAGVDDNYYVNGGEEPSDEILYKEHPEIPTDDDMKIFQSQDRLVRDVPKVKTVDLVDFSGSGFTKKQIHQILSFRDGDVKTGEMQIFYSGDINPIINPGGVKIHGQKILKREDKE